jgi:hypothetical protein
MQMTFSAGNALCDGNYLNTGAEYSAMLQQLMHASSSAISFGYILIFLS